MAHRLSKKERIAAIRDIPDLPGGPMWRLLGPKGRAIPLISIGARELAILAIKHEEMVGLGDKPGHDVQDFDWNAAIRREQQEARWAAMEISDASQPKPIRKKRKVSDYSKQFGIILKALKKKHPRTPITNLMTRAHTETRKVMKKKTKGKLSKGRRVIAKSGQFRRDKILPRK